jgi:DNA-directed RNA polymerase subunit K/omega
MVIRPVGVNPFEFVVVAALRAQQLLAGCVPRVDGLHAPATIAQMEVAGGQIARTTDHAAATSRQCGWQL